MNRTLSLPEAPTQLVMAPDGKRVYVALSSSVVVVDTATFTSVGTVSVGFNPSSSGGIDLGPKPSGPVLTVAVADVQLCWKAVSNVVYQLEYSRALDGTNWQPLGPPVVGNGFTNCVVDSVLGLPRRFYRIRLSSDRL